VKRRLPILVLLLAACAGPLFAQGGSANQNNYPGVGTNGAGSNPLGASLNVKGFPFSAIGDGKVFYDGVSNASNNQITSATAIFSQSDVGHLFSCIKTALSVTAAQAFSSTTATVTSFINSSTVTYSGTNAGVNTGLYCSILDPADPPALLAAFTAAKTTVQGTTGGDVGAYQNMTPLVYLPPGVFALGQTLDNLISTGNEVCVGMVGDGLLRTGIVLTANFVPKTTDAGYIINDRCAGAYLRDFFVDALSLPVNAGGTSITGALNVTGAFSYLSNVSVYNQCITGGQSFGIEVLGGSGIALYHPDVTSSGNCGGTNGGLLWQAAQGDVFTPFLSNTQQNLQIQNQTTGANGEGMRVWGGVVDEGSITLITNSIDTWLMGTTLTGGANCVSVDGTSIVWFFGGYCGTFAANTGGGPTVASGGQAYFTGVHIRAQNAGSYCWGGLGSIFDEGGNICTLAGGGTEFGNSATLVTFPLQTNATTQLGGRQVVSGSVPTGCAVTGNGTSTCALATGSTDAAGMITITAAGTTTAVGVVSITYSSTTGTHQTVCNANYTNNGQTGTWATGAIPPIFVTDTTTAVSFNINNAGTNLNATSTYGVNYECYGD
jgi:hypothetical protein